MRKECTFEELPVKLQEHITAVCKTFEVLKCRQTDKDFVCFVKSDIVGIFSYREDWSQSYVKCTWLSDGDIEILHNTIESTRP